MDPPTVFPKQRVPSEHVREHKCNLTPRTPSEDKSSPLPPPPRPPPPRVSLERTAKQLCVPLQFLEDDLLNVCFMRGRSE